MSKKKVLLFEDFDNDNENDGLEDQSFYFYIEDGGNKSIIEIFKDMNKWRERFIKGDPIHGLGSKTYQSYLSIGDIKTWLEGDYDYVEEIGVDSIDEYI